MIVTLREDIPQLGKKNERVKVSDAYARNVLVPQDKAFVGEQTLFRITAAPPVINHDNLATLLREPFLFELAANEKGTLYKKITSKEVVKKIASRLSLSEHVISMSKDFTPIDQLGEHTVRFQIDGVSYTSTIIAQAT